MVCQLGVNILENCSTWKREEEGEHEEKRRGKIEGFFPALLNSHCISVACKRVKTNACPHTVQVWVASHEMGLKSNQRVVTLAASRPLPHQCRFALARIIVAHRVCSWMWRMTMPFLQQHEWYLRTLQKLSSRGEASKWGPSKFLHVLWLIKDVVSSATVFYYQVLEVDKSTGSRYNPCAWGMSLVNKWKRRDPLWVLELLFAST